MSINIYKDGQLKSVAGSGLMDAELSLTSTNGVQNKVVTAAINELNNDLAKWHFVIRTKTTDANGRIDFGDLNGLIAQHDVYNVTANIVSPHFYTCTVPYSVLVDSNTANWFVRVEEDTTKNTVANTEVTVRLSWYQV